MSNYKQWKKSENISKQNNRNNGKKYSTKVEYFNTYNKKEVFNFDNNEFKNFKQTIISHYAIDINPELTDKLEELMTEQRKNQQNKNMEHITKMIDGPALTGFKKFVRINPTYSKLKNPIDSFGITDEEYINMMRYCPLTSVDVERSFSAYKRLLSDLRHNLSSVNRAFYLKIMFNGIEVPKIK